MEEEQTLVLWKQKDYFLMIFWGFFNGEGTPRLLCSVGVGPVICNQNRYVAGNDMNLAINFPVRWVTRLQYPPHCHDAIPKLGWPNFKTYHQT